ncbi:MAG: peptidylprolyl isomerase [Bacteroidota bacterium]
MKRYQRIIACIGLLFATLHTRAQLPDIAILKTRAPETFQAIFTTTKGSFIIEAYRKWSPLGVDRLYQLITTGFFNEALLFRVEPGFVVQFGISQSRTANRFWDPRKLVDEPMQTQNKKGTISFARGGRNERATQLFINLSDNKKLDTTTRNGVKGYTPIARVMRGMDVIEKLNAQYGKQPIQIQDSLYKYGNFYFEERFPAMDRIKHAAIKK